ncbi:MAG: tRNA (adenine(22)-N(1))-methyltransferase [Bacillota bacterium]
MNLSPRLKKIISFLNLPTKVADIGTDHAYIPIYLAQKTDCPVIIAGEYNRAPYQIAKSNVQETGLLGQVELRLGSGLSILEQEEVTTAIIAGMGATTIKSIIADDYELAQGLDRLIIQAMEGASSLRKWLIENNFLISDEALVEEGERLYQILVIEPGTMEVEDDFLLEIGPKLVENNSSLLLKYLTNLEEEWQFIIDKIAVNAPCHSKIDKLEQKISKVKELKNDCKIRRN